MAPPFGVKSIAFNLFSNLLLGRSLYFLNSVNPIAAIPTTLATTMIAISAVLDNPPDLLSSWASAAATVAEAEAVRVLVTTDMD